jgi:hypothetical protein
MSPKSLMSLFREIRDIRDFGDDGDDGRLKGSLLQIFRKEKQLLSARCDFMFLYTIISYSCAIRLSLSPL